MHGMRSPPGAVLVAIASPTSAITPEQKRQRNIGLGCSLYPICIYMYIYNFLFFIGGDCIANKRHHTWKKETKKHRV